MDVIDYNLYWSVLSAEQSILLAIEVETTNWVGFGVSTTGSMLGADIMTGYKKFPL